MTLLMLENKKNIFIGTEKRPDRRNKSIKRTTRSRKKRAVK